MIVGRVIALLVVIISGLVLMTVIATSLAGALSKTDVHASDSAAHSGSPVNSQDGQKQNVQYPDPSKQNDLPDRVKVTGNGERVLLRTSVEEGNQIYECRASASDPGGFAWKLQAPFALLRADDGTNVIHSTDPTWLFTEDGSEVKGKVGQYINPDGTVVPATATPDANSLPWLRVDVTEHRGNSGL